MARGRRPLARRSEVLLELHMDGCGLQGPIPELHLPALRILYTSDNELTGGLEPLRDCISLEEIGMDGNHLTGTHVKHPRATHAHGRKAQDAAARAQPDGQPGDPIALALTA
eukprot:scaffold54852_cov57-Phaeocystis_antarctica.AAC.5